jgi:hypothetical protein
MAIKFDLDEETLPEVLIPEQIQTETLPEPVKKSPVMDIELAKKQFSPYLEKIDHMVSEAEKLVVETDAANEAATFLGTSAKQLLNKIEGERKSTISDPYSFVKSVNAFVTIFTDKLEAVESMMKRKIAAYTAIREQKRREQELAQKKAADELQTRLNLEAKEKGIEPVTVVVPSVPHEPPITRTETGSSHGRKVWTFEILEPHHVRQLISDLALQWEKVSLQVTSLGHKDGEVIKGTIDKLKALAPYLVISDTEVRNAIKKGGLRDIPGIRIFQDTRTTFRT